jgi:hypothetical protein
VDKAKDYQYYIETSTLFEVALSCAQGLGSQQKTTAEEDCSQAKDSDEAGTGPPEEAHAQRGFQASYLARHSF